jgi:hypothetical protein
MGSNPIPTSLLLLFESNKYHLFDDIYLKKLTHQIINYHNNNIDYN